jgi:hypothetical protein
VSAERVKNGAGDNGFRWDTSVEAVEFPIRRLLLKWIHQRKLLINKLTILHIFSI